MQTALQNNSTYPWEGVDCCFYKCYADEFISSTARTHRILTLLSVPLAEGSVAMVTFAGPMDVPTSISSAVDCRRSQRLSTNTEKLTGPVVTMARNFPTVA
mmetsp:Transcript_2542/g.2588  ORF Transcript_2542/g.2588 Transcript_2542/m.2588 type:complete len:101 (-) Transcript_2542:161-463(-)